MTYQQFLVGSEILVVPVLDKGHKAVKAYFPQGSETEVCSWQHIWTGQEYRNQCTTEACIDAPLGYPAIFVKARSQVGHTFLKNLKNLNIL